MNATFFTEADDCSFSRLDEVPETSILGGGNFSKDNIGELLCCFISGSSTQNDNLWLLSSSFSERLSTVDTEGLKQLAVNWSYESSWEDTEVSPVALAGHLSEIKYAYSGSDQRIWVFFD
jgi:hypothetical protein